MISGSVVTRIIRQPSGGQQQDCVNVSCVMCVIVQAKAVCCERCVFAKENKGTNNQTFDGSKWLLCHTEIIKSIQTI